MAEWMKWRHLRGRSCWLEAPTSELEVVDELVEYMAYCCAVQRNRESTVAGKLVAVNFHEQWMGKSLPLEHSGLRR